MLQARCYRMSGAIPSQFFLCDTSTPPMSMPITVSFNRYCLRNLLHGSPLEYFRFGDKVGSAMFVTPLMLLALVFLLLGIRGSIICGESISVFSFCSWRAGCKMAETSFLCRCCINRFKMVLHRSLIAAGHGLLVVLTRAY